MDISRQHDLVDLEKARKTAPDKETLYNISKVEKTIKDEQCDGWARSARESLIEAARSGREGNVEDVQHRIARKNDKKLGIGKTSFFFSLPKGLK